MDENRRPSTHAVTAQTTISQTPTTTAAQSITTIKREDDVSDQEIMSIRIKPEHDSFSLSDLPAFGREDDGMEVIFEDGDLEEEDADVQEEEIVVIKFGPHYRSGNTIKFGPNHSRVITKRKPDSEEDVPRTKPIDDSDSGLEHTSLRTRKRRKTKTGRANSTATTTTTTELRPKTTTVISVEHLIAQIFSSEPPHAHNDIHTYPLPPDQLHRHSYHSPLLLSFPSNTAEFSSTQDSIATAREHRDALLNWFDNRSIYWFNYRSAARQIHIPWRKPWVDTRPLLATTTASTSASKPKSPSLVRPKVQVSRSSSPIPESVLLFPNLARSLARARAEAETQEQQARAAAKAQAREQKAKDLQTLRTTITQRFYEVLVSETMLQVFVLSRFKHSQNVKNMRLYYNRWMKACPTLADLAAAKDEVVSKLWKDPGASRIHAVAKHIYASSPGPKSATVMPGDKDEPGRDRTEEEEAQSRILPPSTVEELEKLPGMDPYTAGALAAVVFGRAEPMVDENVTRVLARQLGIRGDVRTKEVEGVIQEAARRLVEQVTWDWIEAMKEAEAKKLKAKAKRRKASTDEGGEPAVMADRDTKIRRPPRLSSRAGPWGQALMELGASICLPAPATPRCHSCPIQATCRAYAEGLEIAREKKLVVAPNQNTKKEKDRVALKKKVEDLREQKVVDIEDAACTLCPPPPSPPTPPAPPPPPSGTSSNQIKEETQDEGGDTGDVHYLGTVPKAAPQPLPLPLPLPSNTNKNTQKNKNKDDNNNTTTTISATFYEQDKSPSYSYSNLREYVNNPGKTKPKGYYGEPSAAAKSFITSYCAQYPYTKPNKPERKTTTAPPRSSASRTTLFSKFKYQPT